MPADLERAFEEFKAYVGRRLQDKRDRLNRVEHHLHALETSSAVLAESVRRNEATMTAHVSAVEAEFQGLKSSLEEVKEGQRPMQFAWQVVFTAAAALPAALLLLWEVLRAVR